MYNWSTDTTKFANPTDKRVWEIIQLLDYGLGQETISKKEIIEFWPRIKNQIAPDVKRLLEYVIWNKVSSQPINNNFWIQSPPLQKLPKTST
jgi:hypothetical protein